MKIKRILLGILILIVVALVAAFVFLNQIKTAALPDYNKNIELSGLSAEVNVFRDAYGIPHVYAQSEEDLYRAVGFAMAQDRLWQMDLLRRVTQGRLSEMFGAEQVETDLLMRALRITEKSEKIIKNIDPAILEALEAFSAGVNQYIESYPLPPEFKILGYEPEPWEPVHSVNLVGYMAWDLSMGWGTEYFLHRLRNEVADEKIAELIPKMKNQETAVYPDFGTIRVGQEETLLAAAENLKELGVEIFSGSNNWAVSGKKSKTGMPLLANDMHLGLFAPGIWYQMHQVVDGELNVTGLVLPGQPFVIAGHNSSIAWGMTNVMVDDLDFYAETLNDDSTKYLLDGQWKNLLVKKETVTIKGGDTVEEELKFTHRGPIVNRFKKETGTALSIRWLGNEMSNEIRTVYLLNRAANWTDFREAMKTFKSVSQNVVYADVHGNIGLQCSAGLPIRKGSGIQVYPGDSSKYDWTGLVPFEELPFEFNPERGYVSSANNKTVPDDYPYYVSHWFATPSRIDRIRELLAEQEKHGVEDFERIQADFTSKTAEKLLPVFLKALKNRSDLTGTRATALEALENWDHTYAKESPAASVFEVLYLNVCLNMVKDELSDELFGSIRGERMLLENMIINLLAENGSSWTDNVKTEKVETFDDIVVQSFSQTVEELTDRLGENVEAWNWEKLHTFTLSHPLGVVPLLDRAFKLNRGPYGVPGSFHTVCPYSYSNKNLYKVNHGASHRHIYDTGNWDASKTVIPTGTSGIPASDFYLDQTELYLENLYHPDPFGKEKVEQAKKFEMTFLPKK